MLFRSQGVPFLFLGGGARGTGCTPTRAAVTCTAAVLCTRTHRSSTIAIVRAYVLGTGSPQPAMYQVTQWGLQGLCVFLVLARWGVRPGTCQVPGGWVLGARPVPSQWWLGAGRVPGYPHLVLGRCPVACWQAQSGALVRGGVHRWCPPTVGEWPGGAPLGHCKEVGGVRSLVFGQIGRSHV